MRGFLSSVEQGTRKRKQKARRRIIQIMQVRLF